MHHPFFGVITAIVTPFKNDELDLVAFSRLVELQINAGIKAIIVGGSTGEGLSLNFEEYLALIQEAVKTSEDRIKIIAGSSAPSTRAAIDMLKAAENLGVDGLMSTMPPYVRPSQKGIYQHFKTIHDATNLPIMLYANPGRSASDFNDQTIIELARLPRIAALKDGDTERTLRLSSKLKNFALISSDDITALANRVHGGVGIASVLSNIKPKEVLEVQDAWDKGNAAKALEIFHKLVPIIKSMFVESNPIPIKYAASLLNLCSEEMRLPLCSLEDESKIIVAKALETYAI